MHLSLIILDLAGFAALLLWGVHMVETGVQRTFGPKLNSFLHHATRHRLSAFGAGAAVTIAVQSSTATALMLTAFSVGGLVQLAPALAVMLGANVGTTLVVQALSFDVVAVAPLMILAGVFLWRRAQDRPHDFGRVLIGLGLVLTALHQFLVLLEPVVANPRAHALLAQIGDYTPAVVVLAALITWAAHSSVVTVLLAMSLVTKGVAPFETGLAIVLGANLGSAINPLLEGARGTDLSARRLPIGNLVTRLAGLALAGAFFSELSTYAVRLGPTPARALADFHTLFNLAIALVFLPFVRPFARALERFLPRTDTVDPGEPKHLDPAARETPAVALALAARETLRMADTVQDMLAGLRETLTTSSRSHIEAVRRLDDVLDKLNAAIKAYLISLPPETLKPQESERLAQILAFATNLEHAGDLVDLNLLGVAARKLQRGVSFSAEGEADLIALVDRLSANLRLAAALFVSRDETAARLLVAEKDAFRAIESEGVAAHFRRLQSGRSETVETSSLHLDALRDLKRINSHLVEGAAYPLLQASGALRSTRLRPAGRAG
ncbi:MAG: Na/Pi cotransporter family protein [Phenylobacterium sp.]|nr:MAG: Na/Pi cotransporter family protein [Phenylobacterium sp.]